ncbi:MAG: hypothetical protein ABJF23_00925 [Bryobacteraceae bacterium]
MFRLTTCVFALFLTCSTSAYSATINLGVISFDVLTSPNGADPGVNVFNVTNLTGDPTLAGFALPSDFPVFTFLSFLDSSMTLEDGGPSSVVNIGAVDPGPFASPISLQFPDTAVFTSATFSGMLSHTTLLLADGTTFLADSSEVVATILPFSGQSLVAGGDFAVISITGSIAPTDSVPEPQTGVLVMAAFGLLSVVAKTRRSR